MNRPTKSFSGSIHFKIFSFFFLWTNKKQYCHPQTVSCPVSWGCRIH